MNIFEILINTFSLLSLPLPSPEAASQAFNLKACLGIWCQGVKLLPGFCKNLNHQQDYARYFKKGPFSLHLGVLLSSMEAPSRTVKT